MKENRIVASYPPIARLEEHLSLKSLSARTREECPRYIRKLTERFGKDPALLEEQDARAYLLYLKSCNLQGYALRDLR
jgi:hypothetical protein